MIQKMGGKDAEAEDKALCYSIAYRWAYGKMCPPELKDPKVFNVDSVGHNLVQKRKV